MTARRLLVAGCLLGGVLYVGAGALKGLVPHDVASQVALAQNLLDVDAFQQLIRQVILDGLKPDYVSQHNWGHQSQASHVKVRGKWFAPRIEKTESAENDGLWQRFEVTLVEPEQNMHTRLERIDALPDGRVRFSLLVDARLSGTGQFQRWQRGTRLFSVSGDSESTVAARIECELGIHREPGTLADDVVLDPRVTAIHLELVDLDLKRVGKLGHDVSRELGAALRPTIAQELERREPKLVAKANASIEKRHDRLRFSLDQFVASSWSKLATAVAGVPSRAPVRQ